MNQKLLNIKNKTLNGINKIFSIIFVYASFTANAFAGEVGSTGKLTNPLGAQSLSQFFDGIVGVAIQLGAVIAGLSIMYGGFLYVTAMGDEEKIGKAYKTMTWSLVGTAVLLGAHVIMLAIKGTIEQLN